MKRKTLMWLFVLLTIVSLLATACGTGEEVGLEEVAEEAAEEPEEAAEPEEEEAEEEAAGLDRAIIVGSKDFTEQLILGSMVVQLLEANGYEVDDQTGLGGTTVNREALEAGEIDVYWEYTGTALVNFLGIEEVITDPDEAYNMSRDADAANGLAWLVPANFNNTYTLMVGQATIDAGITSISDLAAAVNESPDDYRLCTNA